jgi:hypothetical protein
MAGTFPEREQGRVSDARAGRFAELQETGKDYYFPRSSPCRTLSCYCPVVPVILGSCVFKVDSVVPPGTRQSYTFIHGRGSDVGHMLSQNNGPNEHYDTLCNQHDCRLSASITFVSARQSWPPISLVRDPGVCQDDSFRSVVVSQPSW